jgi:hypothetical protein
VVIEPTQADQNEATVQWLPPSLSCVRGDTDSAELSLVAADHPLFHTPNELSEEDFAGWGFSGWPTVWEAIASQEGFEVLAESAGMSVIMEAKYGGGAFVLMSLAPDTYHVVGNDAFTRNKAGLFMQNILSLYAERVVVTGSCPGSMSLDMRGLTAGGPWTLMSGLGYGSTTLADGHCSGTETGLGGTLRQIDGIADPYGRYRLDFDAPPAACGTRLQLLDLASCELSSVYGL